jgi:hypothetical protein
MSVIVIMTMKIAFFIRHFGERGTEVSVYDYAHYNETLLGNQSIIIGFKPEVYAQFGLTCMPDVLEKFCKRFRVYLVNSFAEVDPLLRRENVDVYYTQTHGAKERPPFGDVTVCTYAVHCVFETRQPHGDIYFSISQQLNDRFGTSVPVVPYPVHRGTTTENMRAELGIPDDAIVFGRHGAMDTFDIPIARDAVAEIASENPSVYFLFMNTPRFCELPNVIHLPKTIDVEAKQRFINTCDAYLHARSDGETFGLAVAEFAVSDKPIIARTICTDDAHFRILGDKVYRYTTKEDLLGILRTFRRGAMDMTENGYKQFTIENVMHAFRDIVCRPRAPRAASFLYYR